MIMNRMVLSPSSTRRTGRSTFDNGGKIFFCAYFRGFAEGFKLLAMRRVLPVLSVLIFVPGAAEAHIKLLEPASWTTENFLGDPQKESPCGGERGTPTGAVTQFRPGETITVRWEETIYHPGHYRIAFAMNRAELIDPVVTLDANQISVSATIQDPPVAPVLLDGLFPRTSQSGSPGTVFEQQVTLPNMPCMGCTLQVIQFMAGHGPPNYIYYHCATIDLVEDMPNDAGMIGEPDAIDDAGMIGEPDAIDGMDAIQGIDVDTPADAGMMTHPDATAVLDATADFDASAGAKTTVGGSCGCNVRSKDHSGAWLLLFALYALRRLHLR
jgi:hypothetical protein